MSGGGELMGGIESGGRAKKERERKEKKKRGQGK